MSLVITAHYDAGAAQAAVPKDLGRVMRPLEKLVSLRAWEVRLRSRLWGGLKKNLQNRSAAWHGSITPNRTPSASLLASPSWTPPGPGGEGLVSLANRAASGPHWDAAGSAISIQPYAPG